MLSDRWAMTYPCPPTASSLPPPHLPVGLGLQVPTCHLVTAYSTWRKWNWEAQECPHPSKAGRCPLPSGTSPWPSRLRLLVSEPTLLSWVWSFREAKAWYWSFSFSISPSYEYSGLIPFRMHWSDQYLTLIHWPPDAKNCLI